VRPSPKAIVAIAACALALVVTACGGSSAPRVNPQVLLQRAEAVVDATPALHFSLTTSGVSGSGIDLTGGSGDLVRPDSLRGSFTVTENGFSVKVSVVSTGGVFEALLPFSTRYQKTNPSAFGLANPAQLLDPAGGLATILSDARSPRTTGQQRLDGQLVDTVTFDLPGAVIPVLPDANPSRAVGVAADIDPKTYQLRQVILTGFFTNAASESTYVVTLTDYGEHVTVTLPPAS
jgi:hypothetical protein